MYAWLKYFVIDISNRYYILSIFYQSRLKT